LIKSYQETVKACELCFSESAFKAINGLLIIDAYAAHRKETQDNIGLNQFTRELMRAVIYEKCDDEQTIRDYYAEEIEERMRK
jgi:hypothetical protein